MMAAALLLSMASCFANARDLRGLPNGFKTDSRDPESVEISVLDPSEVDSLFRKFVQDPSIPFETYYRCEAKATAMARIAERDDIRLGKIFARGKLLAKSERFPGRVFGWGGHIAPVVYVKQSDGRIELQVLDPTLYSGPVSVDRWTAGFLKNHPPYMDVPLKVESVRYGSRFQYLFDPEFKAEWSQEDLETADRELSLAFQLIENEKKGQRKQREETRSWWPSWSTK